MNKAVEDRYSTDRDIWKQENQLNSTEYRSQNKEGRSIHKE